MFWPGRSQFPNYDTFPGLFKCAVQYTKYIDLWGAHIVDCVSAYYNHKLPKFSSRLWSPNTAGVDLRGGKGLVVHLFVLFRVCYIMRNLSTLLVYLLYPFDLNSTHYWPLIVHHCIANILSSTAFIWGRWLLLVEGMLIRF